MSGSASRSKGAAGERESAAIFEAAGWRVRPLQSGQGSRSDAGDFLADWRTGLVVGDVHLIVQARRREKTRVLEASRQIEAVARDGEVPVVVYRPSREPWRVSLRLDDLLRLLA
jgi:Holliday junction resolvase